MLRTFRSMMRPSGIRKRTNKAARVQFSGPSLPREPPGPPGREPGSRTADPVRRSAYHSPGSLHTAKLEGRHRVRRHGPRFDFGLRAPVAGQIQGLDAQHGDARPRGCRQEASVIAGRSWQQATSAVTRSRAPVSTHGADLPSKNSSEHSACWAWDCVSRGAAPFASWPPFEAECRRARAHPWIGSRWVASTVSSQPG